MIARPLVRNGDRERVGTKGMNDNEVGKDIVQCTLDKQGTCLQATRKSVRALLGQRSRAPASGWYSKDQYFVLVFSIHERPTASPKAARTNSVVFAS